MAEGHPKFGSTNNVEALDVGQNGGTRAGAGQALWIGEVHEEPAEAASAIVGIPGNNLAYRNVSGSTGRRVFWRGNLKTDTRARLRTIYEELDVYVHGGLSPADPKQLGATLLTSSDGETLSDYAVMAGWKPTSRVYRLSTGSFLYLVGIEIEFRILR